MNKAQSKSRITLLVIIAIFLLPVFAAIFLNSNWSDWKPGQTKNHGELIQPVLEMQAIDSLNAANFSQGVWTLLYAPQSCNQQCLDMLATLLRVRLATGRHQDELNLLLASPQLEVTLGEEYAALTVVNNNLIHAGLKQAGFSEGLDQTVFLVDPQGYLMMRYPVGFDPTGIRKDLGRLLKYSKFNDE